MSEPGGRAGPERPFERRTGSETDADEARALRESRRRIIRAGNAERRRIERDLHDGVQQHLVALAVRVRLARDLIFEAPDEARDLLDQLGDDIRGSLNALRALAHHIYPALLVDGGLVDALAVAAGRSGTGAVVGTTGIGRYPPDVEAAVYFTCAETLAYLGDAAGEGGVPVGVGVKVWEEGDRVCFEVSATGPALTALQDTDLLALLGDRVGAAGGSVEVGSADGGRSRLTGSVDRA